MRRDAREVTLVEPVVTLGGLAVLTRAPAPSSARPSTD